jgi:LCP family protein required for cell wall assembly
MVVSVDPVTGANAAFSVPRDTVNFPLPGGGVYPQKVNGLYTYLGSRTGDAGKAMKTAVSRGFGIEVDRYVFIGFTGVKELVRAAGGVDVTLDAPYYDPEYWVTSNQRGWGLPKGTSHLNGDDALIFARSRKGDNDFGRARRQQLLVMAAFDKVRVRGIAGLADLIAIARDTVRTDLPLDRAGDIYNLFSKVDLGKTKRVVFGPRSYASGVGATDFALRLDVCRAWIARNFPPVRKAQAASSAEPASSASPAP